MIFDRHVGLKEFNCSTETLFSSAVGGVAEITQPQSTTSPCTERKLNACNVGVTYLLL